MDRVGIKQQASELVKGNRPVLYSTVLFLLLVVVFSLLSYRLIMPSVEELMQISDLAAAGDYEGTMASINKLREPRFGESLMSDVLTYLQGIVAFGYLMLLLHVVRGESAAPGMLLDGFGVWIPVLLLEIVTRFLFSTLLMLLIVPGIIARYVYRMARYLLICHPELGVLGSMRESRIRMRGHKMELFVLDLSYLGWVLLSCVPILGIVAAVYALPRWECASLLYYEAISAPFEAAPKQDRQPPFPPI